MTTELVLALANAAQPIYDILPPPTATAVRAAGPAADLAPAGGMDFLVVGLIAVVMAVALLIVIRSRKRR